MTKLLERVHTLIYEDGYPNTWGWWCKTCTPSSVSELVGRDGLQTRGAAVRYAASHEENVHGVIKDA